MKNKNFHYGFTYLELIIVVVIIGILASFGVPQYLKTVQKAKQRDVAAMMHLVKGAQEMYHNRTGSYYPATATTILISDINQNLNLDILQPADIVYQCQGTNGSSFSCAGGHPDLTAPRWTITVTQATDPVCSAGTGSCYF